MINSYIKILGKINLISCLTLALIILYTGLVTTYEQIVDVYKFGDFWDYLFFWEYLGSLLFFIPIIAVVLYYGAFFYIILRDYEKLQKKNSQFKNILNTSLVVTLLIFTVSCWKNYIIVSILISIPLVYYLSIFININQTNQTN
ncbi:signal transduction histidine kinase [Epilithonimonas hungarica]|nr:signal transduction histidine kinase [Epilithonimonas hungarica]